jgi:hypothetical protein
LSIVIWKGVVVVPSSLKLELAWLRLAVRSTPEGVQAQSLRRQPV